MDLIVNFILKNLLIMSIVMIVCDAILSIVENIFFKDKEDDINKEIKSKEEN